MPKANVAFSPKAGIAAFAAYLVVFYGVWTLRGIDYPHIGDNAHTLFNWYALPLICGAIILAVVTTYLGWWKPAIYDSVKAPPIARIVPIITAVIAVVSIFLKDTSGVTAWMLVWVLVGSIGVGFCEELASRGVLIAGLRGSYDERKVFLVSTTLFALLHLPNWIFGAGPATLLQLVSTFLLGSTLYLTRRATGSLIPAMMLHGVWDFAAFLGVAHGIGLYMPILGMVLGIVSVVIALKITKPGVSVANLR